MIVKKTLHVLLTGVILKGCFSPAFSEGLNVPLTVHYAKVTEPITVCKSEQLFKSMVENKDNDSYLSLLLTTNSCQTLDKDTLVRFKADNTAVNKDIVQLEPYGLYTMLVFLKYRSELIEQKDIPQSFMRSLDGVSESCDNCLSM